jgi:hypothetical protein
VGKPAGRVPSPDDNSRRFKLAVPQRRCAPEYLNKEIILFLGRISPASSSGL